MSVSRAPRSGSAVAAVLLGLALVALELRLRGETGLRAQVAGQLAAFALFVPAAVLAWRGFGIGRAGLALVLLVAIGLRAAAFDPGGAPTLSTDLYRYAWDARVQAHGINPYRYAPADPELAELREVTVWPNVNLADWKTVYPPGAEASFFAARLLFGDGPRASTWLFLAAEAAAVGLLLLVLRRSGAPLERIAVYAWHPLAVSEIAANGHVDGLTVLAGAGLLAAWQSRRYALAGVAAAAGALVRYTPLLLVPPLACRGGPRFVGAAAATAALVTAPYLSVGGGVVGSLGDYVERQRFGGSLWWALANHVGLSEAAATAFCAAAVGVLVAVVSLREHATVEQAARTALLVLGAAVIAVGYVQPWHALGLLPFLCVAVAPGWLWLTGTLPLLYLFGLENDLPGWVRAVVYGPLGVWVAWRLLRGSRALRPAPPHLPPLPQRPRVAAVIPALDEAAALPSLLFEFPPGVVDEVVVVDGGSRDGTPEAARAAGARVLVEPRRGYGRACATGAAATSADVIVFLDGDGSDDPARLSDVLRPVLAGEAALSLGSRVDAEDGALRPHQALGNRLVALLVRLVYGVSVRDIAPMRAVRRDVLDDLRMSEMTYGWPTEMLVKAARRGLPVAEAPVRSRARRGGESKVSGRLWPSAQAGALMLAVVARHS
jgi:hypothetical protein